MHFRDTSLLSQGKGYGCNQYGHRFQLYPQLELYLNSMHFLLSIDDARVLTIVAMNKDLNFLQKLDVINTLVAELENFEDIETKEEFETWVSDLLNIVSSNSSDHYTPFYFRESVLDLKAMS